MSLTKEQKKIILGMARNIMDNAVKVDQLESLEHSEYFAAMQLPEARNELDFSQRRLEVYLETLVGDE